VESGDSNPAPSVPDRPRAIPNRELTGLAVRGVLSGGTTRVSLPQWLAVPFAAMWFCVMALAYVGLVIVAGVLLVARFAQAQYCRHP
jgi:hypothetical protein